MICRAGAPVPGGFLHPAQTNSQTGRYGVENGSVGCSSTTTERPHEFFDHTGCELRFRFPAVTVRHWERRWPALEHHTNPFAVVVMAHLKARQVRPGEARKQWKLRLMRGLYERGRSREDILALFRFIDWLLVLPAALEQAFWQELRQVEEAHRMPYVTSVERFGIQQGLHQGQLLEARAMVLEAVAAHFGAVPEDVATAVQRVESRDTLHTLLRQAIACPTLEAFRTALGAVQS